MNTLHFAHVKTGYTPEDRVAVIKATTHQDIIHHQSDNDVISELKRFFQNPNFNVLFEIVNHLHIKVMLLSEAEKFYKTFISG